MNGAMLKTLVNVAIAAAWRWFSGFAFGVAITDTARCGRGLEAAVRHLLRDTGLCVLSAVHHFVRPRRYSANPDRLHAGGRRRDRQHTQRLDRVVAGADEDGADLPLGPVRTARKITLPSAAPYLLTGVKLAVAYAFIGVIGAEFIMSRSGIGYEISFCLQ